MLVLCELFKEIIKLGGLKSHNAMQVLASFFFDEIIGIGTGG